MILILLSAPCQAQTPGVGTQTVDTGEAQPRGKAGKVVYSWVDNDGRIRMAGRSEDIPEAFRARVVVTDTARSRSARLSTERVMVVDLRRDDGKKPLNYSLVDLDRLTGEARPRGEATDPGSLGRLVVGKLARMTRRLLGLPHEAEPVPARVVLYSTPWCGFCKKAAKHLRQMGVAFIERDIENDSLAASELSGKLRRAGLSGAGVPVLDIGGTIVIGFDVERIDRLLKKR